MNFALKYGSISNLKIRHRYYWKWASEKILEWGASKVPSRGGERFDLPASGGLRFDEKEHGRAPPKMCRTSNEYIGNVGRGIRCVKAEDQLTKPVQLMPDICFSFDSSVWFMSVTCINITILLPFLLNDPQPLPPGHTRTQSSFHEAANVSECALKFWTLHNDANHTTGLAST